MPIRREPFGGAYEEAMGLCRQNIAAMEVLATDDHHTVACIRFRQTFPTACSCDLMVHLADVIRAERKRRA